MAQRDTRRLALTVGLLLSIGCFSTNTAAPETDPREDTGADDQDGMAGSPAGSAAAFGTTPEGSPSDFASGGSDEPVDAGVVAARRGDAAFPSFEGTTCILAELTVTPSDLSPTDGCYAVLECQERVLGVECDGENDGTFTSLCDCDAAGARTSVEGVVEGEGREACLAAARRCGADGDF